MKRQLKIFKMKYKWNAIFLTKIMKIKLVLEVYNLMLENLKTKAKLKLQN